VDYSHLACADIPSFPSLPISSFEEFPFLISTSLYSRDPLPPQPEARPRSHSQSWLLVVGAISTVLGRIVARYVLVSFFLFSFPFLFLSSIFISGVLAPNLRPFVSTSPSIASQISVAIIAYIPMNDLIIVMSRIATRVSFNAVP
jgi:hypothetical protein